MEATTQDLGVRRSEPERRRSRTLTKQFRT